MSIVNESKPNAKAPQPTVEAAVAAGGSGKKTGGCIIATGADSPGEPLFLVSEYDGRSVTEFVGTASQVLSLDPKSVDCHIDEAFGRVSIRLADSSYLTPDGGIPRLGPQGRALLDELMRAPGRLLTVRYLTKNPGLSSLEGPPARAQAVRRLRIAFHEDAGTGRYFGVLSHPWRARWNPERTWRVIEPLPE
ncbi:MAG: hypothetical protein JW955_24715 [Sedimentisphaerales bacterium]|nr:hypothetical protein [Sedimentisphaerales bacterium]